MQPLRSMVHRTVSSILSTAVSLFAFFAVLPANPVHGQQISKLEEFHLVNGDGHLISLNPDASVYVIAFLGVECPVSRLYAPRLQSIADRYRSKGVQVIGIDSNLQDSRADIEAFSKSFNLEFPIGKDHNQRIALQLHATRVPEVFVVDEYYVVRYRGRIDDQYQPGLKRAEPTRDDLKIAIDEVLSGRDVSVPETTSHGCRIAWQLDRDAPSEVTFCKSIAPILNRHCVECHRSGEIGPFAAHRL